jgi:hypothetical protein
LRWRLARLEDETAGLRDEQRQLGAERERLQEVNEPLAFLALAVVLRLSL